MKNRLLALMAICGATSSTMPLWGAWEDPTLQFVKPNLATDGTGGGVYYIYHVATQKFMVNGNYKNNWNTELVVGDEGKEVTLSYGEDYELIRRPESDPEYSTAKGWRMSMMDAPSNGGYHELFIREASQVICVDHNKTGHILWKITPQGDDTYRIKIIDEDKKFGVEAQNGLYKNTCVAVNDGETGVNPLLDSQTEGFQNAGLDWKFVTPEVYESYKAKGNLKAALEAADEAGYTQYEKYAELYRNPEASAEAVTEAAQALQQEVVNWKSSSATPEQPANFTNAITNNAFDSNNDGWDIVGSIGYQSGATYETPNNENKMDHFSEKWVTSANNGNLSSNPMDISQTLENMPTGKYRLTANTIGYYQGDWENTVPNGVYLYAENNGIEFRAEAHTTEFGGIQGTNGAKPETPSPRKTVLEFLTLDGTLKIGFKTVNTNCNWVAVDNFKLEYLGQAQGGMSAELQKVIDEAQDLKDSYTSNNVTFSQAGEEKFDNVLKTANEAVANPDLDDKAIGLVLTSVRAAMDTLRADVAAYETLASETAKLEEEYSETPYEAVGLPAYDDYLDELYIIHQERTFDPADVDSIRPRANRIFKEAVTQALKEGTTDNVTGLLTNPNFTDNNDGWTKTGDGDFKHGNAVSEVWNGKDWEVYQELTGLPEGSYKITMQGFYSPSSDNNTQWHESWGQEGDTSNKIMASFFGNDAAQPLLHVMACPQDTNVVNDCEEVTWSDEPTLAGKWICRGKASAQAVFEADENNYLNSTTCYVTEDGKLRLGVKLSGVTWKAAWVTYDNFQVTYLGANDMTGAVSSLNALIAQATEMATNEEVPNTTEAKEILNTAIQNANQAISDGLTIDSYKAQTASLNTAIELGNKALKAAAEFKTLVTEHSDNFNAGNYDEYSNTDEYGALQDLLWDEMEPALESLESIAWIEEATGRINEAYARMIATTVDTSGASIDTPTDMTALIQSPSFSAIDPESAEEVASIKGWVTAEGNNANATSALNYEFIVGKGDADIHQTLYALPKGYYRLTYNGFYRAGGYIEAAVAHRDSTDALNAQVYVESGEGKWEKPLASIFDNVSEYKYDEGDVSLPDTLFTDSELLYHFIANGVNGAKAVFNEGLYEGNFAFYVSEDGQPTVIGVRKEEVIPNDWAIFDNFQLLYYGDGETNKPEDFVSAIDETKATGQAKVVTSAWYTLNGLRVAEPKQRGIYIRQDLMDDGTRKSVKVMIK